MDFLNLSITDMYRMAKLYASDYQKLLEKSITLRKKIAKIQIKRIQSIIIIEKIYHMIIKKRTIFFDKDRTQFFEDFLPNEDPYFIDLCVKIANSFNELPPQMLLTLGLGDISQAFRMAEGDCIEDFLEDLFMIVEDLDFRSSQVE